MSDGAAEPAAQETAGAGGAGEDGYRKGSLSLWGTVAMGTGVMVGAGIFALTGQVAELSGALFPLAFLVAAVVSAISAYSYIRVTSAYPSAGGIAMVLAKAYGRGALTAAASMLMALSMVINESLVARTFGTYTLQLFEVQDPGWYVPALAIVIIVVGFAINIAGNEVIGSVSKVAAVLKVGGILVFALATLAAAGFAFTPASAGGGSSTGGGVGGFIAAVALGILAYKGFTTITNSGGEVEDPHRNVGRAILISLAVCVVVYGAVTWAVGSTLTVDQIVEAKDFALAEASRPAFGSAGVIFTVLVAVIATSSGILASFFAVSRMLAMLTDMELIPHRHFGMPGTIQQHTLVYTVVVAGLLAVLFDLSRIAAIGAIFYLVMDMAVHWGVLRHLHDDVGARRPIVAVALVLDAIVLTAFALVKGADDPVIVIGSIAGIAAILAFETVYLKVRGHAPSDGAAAEG